MEQHNSSSNATTSASFINHSGPCHKLDNWLVSGAQLDSNAQFAAAVVDVARGAKVIASILAEHLVDLSAIATHSAPGVRTLLSENDTQALSRLAVFSLDQLYLLAEGRVDHFNARAAGEQA